MFSFDIATNTALSSIDNSFYTSVFYVASWLFNFWPFCLLLLLTVAVAWKWSKKEERKRTIILLIGAPFFAFVLSWALKLTFDIARPVGERLSALGPSFPSAHTAVATAYFLILLHFAKQTKDKYRRAVHYVFCLLCPVFVGVSRLYFGVHWLSDVIVGYVIGAFCVYITIHIARVFLTQSHRLKSRKQSPLGQ